MKNIDFLSEDFKFLKVKFSTYWNIRVFVISQDKRAIDIRVKFYCNST